MAVLKIFMGLLSKLFEIKTDPDKPKGLRTDANTLLALQAAAEEDPDVTEEQRREIATRAAMVAARAEAFGALPPDQKAAIVDGSARRTRQRHGLPPKTD